MSCCKKVGEEGDEFSCGRRKHKSILRKMILSVIVGMFLIAHSILLVVSFSLLPLLVIHLWVWVHMYHNLTCRVASK
jgi:hypothetical protein